MKGTVKPYVGNHAPFNPSIYFRYYAQVKHL